MVGVWEAVSDSCQAFFLRTQLKGAKVFGFLNEGPCCNDLQYLKWERSQTHKHIHMLAFLCVTTPTWVLFQWKVPTCSAKLLTRAKQSGDWGGRRKKKVRWDMERGEGLSGAESCQPPGTCAELSACVEQSSPALTGAHWLCRPGRCLVICCCPYFYCM